MIYLDHNSTSACDPEVVEKMSECFSRRFGNPRSRDHAFGWDADEAVEEARAQVASLLGAGRHEILFTGCATESVHLALAGLFPGTADLDGGGGVLHSPVEHEAVLGACRRLDARGVPVHRLPVDTQGRLELASLASALSALSARKPKVLALMAANNETGVLFPIRECAALAHAHGALLFVDATQALGRIPLDATEDGFDLAAFSAHKIHGPKGVGALYLRGGAGAIPLEPLWTGGGQENGLRAGTHNVPGIVGFGEACRIARERMAGDMARIRRLRDRLEDALLARFPEVRVNGDRKVRLPNTSNLRFPGVDARALIRDMHDVAVSTRSACGSGSTEPSHVLKAMGLSDGEAFSSLRFSLGRFTTEEEIDRAVEKASAAYARLRPAASPALA